MMAKKKSGRPPKHPRGRGRPSLADPRHREVRIKLNEIEFARISAAAAASAMPVACYMRYAAMVAQLPSAAPVPPEG